MKKIIISLTFITSILASQYLQEGLYPECSYVIVNEEGWKVHYNQDGKTISMTPESKHNTKIGKYSFDKFGNLVPFQECIPESITTVDKIENESYVKIDLEINLFKIFEGMKVYGGFALPIGSSSDLYDSGFGFGGSRRSRA